MVGYYSSMVMEHCYRELVEKYLVIYIQFINIVNFLFQNNPSKIVPTGTSNYIYLPPATIYLPFNGLTR